MTRQTQELRWDAARGGAIRSPAVAGTFYPAAPNEAKREVQQHLAQGERRLLESGVDVPGVVRCLIAPHAGYAYSGPVAGTAYAALRRSLATRPAPRRVLLIGPCHRLAFSGLAVSGCAAFETPMGTVGVDEAGVQGLVSTGLAQVLEAAHEAEHALEVHLPFLISVLGASNFVITPVVVGEATAEATALAMEPKVLLMDEPFGALDALTRASLQDSLLEIQTALGMTVIIVTHDVDEAVLLSDKVVMLTNGPHAHVGEIIHVPLPRPRDRLALAEDQAFIHCRAELLRFLHSAHPAKAA